MVWIKSYLFTVTKNIYLYIIVILLFPFCVYPMQRSTTSFRLRKELNPLCEQKRSVTAEAKSPKRSNGNLPVRDHNLNACL